MNTQTYTTHLWLDGEECTAEVQYRIDEIDPTENWGRHGEKTIVIERVELSPSRKVEEYLVASIEAAEARTALDRVYEDRFERGRRYA